MSTLANVLLLLPVLGPAAIAGIGAIGGVLSNGINAIFNKKANEKSWERAQQSYSRERADNLSDWQMQNAYNHPTEQMKRMREAGLNPAIMYGGGQGVTTAQTPKSASQESPQYQPASVDLGGIVGQFVQTMQMQQQTDNLRELNKNLELRNQGQNLQNLLTDLNISRADRALKMDDLKLGVMPQQLNYSLDAQRIRNNLANAQTQFSLDENQRRALLTTQSLKEGVKRLLQMDLQRDLTQAQTNQIKAAIRNLERDTTIKDFEIQLNKAGFTKTDPAYLRMAKKLYDNYSPWKL